MANSKFFEINQNQDDSQEKIKNTKKIPGGKLSRILRTSLVVSKLVVDYKIGIDLVRDAVIKYPKIDTSLKRSGQVCVMTGGGRGIGFEILKILMELDFTVILGVRNLKGMENGIKRIRGDFGIFCGNVKILYLDLKSLDSVRKFAGEILGLKEAKRIDMLINHAGVFQTEYEVTPDNLECHFQVNYLSHFLLTNLLLPRIKETATLKKDNSSCHIINTSSRLQTAASIHFDNLAEKNLNYVALQCYCDTKLCQIMHARSLQSHLKQEGVKNVQIYAMHPGQIPTQMWSQVGLIEMIFHPLLKAMFKTKKDAANIILYPAFDQKQSKICGGNYFEIKKVAKPNKQGDDEQMRKSLWEMSIKLTSKNES